MSDEKKQEARRRTEMLVELRKQYAEEVKRAQELLKQQQSVRKKLQQAMKGSPISVPQLARQAAMPAHVVLWHIAAMKKYGLVEESGMDESGDYYLYSLTKEAKP